MVEEIIGFIVAWRGLACVAYSCMGAMRRPDSGDRHGGKTPMSFFSTNFKHINAELGS